MKNKSLWLIVFIVWVILSLATSLFCVINILFNNTIVAILFLPLVVGCAVVTGKTHETYKAAKILDDYMSKRISEFMELVKKSNEPFQEFNVPFPEVKKKENNDD